MQTTVSKDSSAKSSALGIADPHIDLAAELLGALAAELGHLGAELDAGEPDTVG